MVRTPFGIGFVVRETSCQPPPGTRGTVVLLISNDFWLDFPPIVTLAPGSSDFAHSAKVYFRPWATGISIDSMLPWQENFPSGFFRPAKRML